MKRVSFSVVIALVIAMASTNFGWAIGGPDRRVKTCERCDGTGKKYGSNCFECGGRGIVHWDGQRQRDLSRGIKNCPNCGGSGKKDGSSCFKCSGSGIVTANGMPQRFDGVKKCPSCGGSGQSSASGLRNCLKCSGSGIIRSNGMPQER